MCHPYCYITNIYCGVSPLPTALMCLELYGRGRMAQVVDPPLVGSYQIICPGQRFLLRWCHRPLVGSYQIICPVQRSLLTLHCGGVRWRKLSDTCRSSLAQLRPAGTTACTSALNCPGLVSVSPVYNTGNWRGAPSSRRILEATYRQPRAQPGLTWLGPPGRTGCEFCHPTCTAAQIPPNV